jgi:PST family polysaccharide transporter
MTVLMFPLLALLSVTAPVVVPWVFGHQWEPAVAPTQVLAIGGASALLIDSVGATLMAAGRARTLLVSGWAHFAAYGIAVLIAVPFGLVAVAVAASLVHTAFVFVVYALMLRGTGESVRGRIWGDVGPALTSTAALVAASVPVSIAMTGLHAPPAINFAAIAAAGGCAYIVALRTLFTPTWESFVRFTLHLMPAWARPRRRTIRVSASPASES